MAFIVSVPDDPAAPPDFAPSFSPHQDEYPDADDLDWGKPSDEPDLPPPPVSPPMPPMTSPPLEPPPVPPQESQNSGIPPKFSATFYAVGFLQVVLFVVYLYNNNNKGCNGRSEVSFASPMNIFVCVQPYSTTLFGVPFPALVLFFLENAPFFHITNFFSIFVFPYHGYLFSISRIFFPYS